MKLFATSLHGHKELRSVFESQRSSAQSPEKRPSSSLLDPPRPSSTPLRNEFRLARLSYLIISPARACARRLPTREIS